MELRQELNILQKELDGMRRRREELTTLFKHLYEDHVLGQITNEQFRLLSADYNAEQKTLDEAIPEKEAWMDKLRTSVANVDAFIEKAKRYRSIDKLTPELVRLFISRIEIGEREVKYSRNAAQKVRIVYRDIGEWDYDMTAEEVQPHMVRLPQEAAEIPA